VHAIREMYRVFCCFEHKKDVAKGNKPKESNSANEKRKNCETQSIWCEASKASD
jgi:hypothetical protein